MPRSSPAAEVVPIRASHSARESRDSTPITPGRRRPDHSICSLAISALDYNASITNASITRRRRNERPPYGEATIRKAIVGFKSLPNCQQGFELRANLSPAIRPVKRVLRFPSVESKTVGPRKPPRRRRAAVSVSKGAAFPPTDRAPSDSGPAFPPAVGSTPRVASTGRGPSAGRLKFGASGKFGQSRSFYPTDTSD